MTGETPIAPSSDVHERLDGLRSWLGQIERKLGVRSYVGGAAAILALAAGIAALVLALQANRDSATKQDVADLNDRITQVAREAGQSTQDDLNSLAERIDDIDQRLSDVSGQSDTNRKQISVLQDDIDELRQQVEDLKSSPDSGNNNSSP